MKNIPPLSIFSLKAEGGTNSVNRKCNPLRRSCVWSARNAGKSAIGPVRAQPSAEIVRVECAKRRRECDWSGVRATRCGDRACRGREVQARVRFGDLPLHLWRESRTKRSFVRLAASLLEEVSYTHRHRYTHRHTHTETHTLTQHTRLNTSHFTHNSHSNFTRGEKCFRATRRLVSFWPGKDCFLGDKQRQWVKICQRPCHRE